jgi:hypothetical protein
LPRPVRGGGHEVKPQVRKCHACHSVCVLIFGPIAIGLARVFFGRRLQAWRAVKLPILVEVRALCAVCPARARLGCGGQPAIRGAHLAFFRCAGIAVPTSLATMARRCVGSRRSRSRCRCIGSNASRDAENGGWWRNPCRSRRCSPLCCPPIRLSCCPYCCCSCCLRLWSLQANQSRSEYIKLKDICNTDEADEAWSQ